MTRKILRANKLIYKNQCVARIHTARERGGIRVLSKDKIKSKKKNNQNWKILRRKKTFLKCAYDHERRKPSYTSIAKK